jgi:hypothetical protein
MKRPGGCPYCGQAKAVDAALAIFSDAGASIWIFLGRFFCARKQAFYGRTKLDFILPVVLLCYPKIPCREKRYMPYIPEMYGNRNYYRPPLDEASKIIWKILLR